MTVGYLAAAWIVGAVVSYVFVIGPESSPARYHRLGMTPPTWSEQLAAVVLWPVTVFAVAMIRRQYPYRRRF